MKKIDFRVRPPYKRYKDTFFAHTDYVAKIAQDLGLPYTESLKQKSLELLLKEMDKAEVEISVVPGRGFMGVDNEELLELTDLYPGRFIVFPFVHAVDTQNAIDTVERLIIQGKGKGVAVEPFYGQNAYRFDDERAFPLYKLLEEHNIPLLVTFSRGFMNVLDSSAPAQIDIVAQKFPGLKIVLAHGGFPYSRELIAAAFANHNIYFVPDVYGVRFPGAEDYIKAANTVLGSQILYGSSYPVLPIVETVEYFDKESGLKESVKEKFFYKNAAEILNIK